MSVTFNISGLPDMQFSGTAHVLHKMDMDYIIEATRQGVCTVQELMKDRGWSELYTWRLVRHLHTQEKIGLAGSVVGPA